MAVLTLDVRGPACSLLSHAHKRINVASQCCFYHVLRHSIPTGVDEVVLKTVREFWEWNNFLVSHTRRSVCVRPLPSFLSFNRSVSLTHVGDRDEAVMSLAVPRHSIWLWPIGSTLNIGLNYKCQRFEFCWRCKKKKKKQQTNLVVSRCHGRAGRHGDVIWILWKVYFVSVWETRYRSFRGIFLFIKKQRR